MDSKDNPWSNNHVTDCAKAIGIYGEEVLALPVLCGVFKFQQLTDLNRKCRKNFPWADFHGWRDGCWWIISVKARSKWQKPNSKGVPYRNKLYIGSTRLRLERAAELLPSYRLPAAHRKAWLALALDTDQTFDAYWGFLEEMRETRRETYSTPSLAIDLSDEMIRQYMRRGRAQEGLQHGFPWRDYPETWWTYEAHKKWLERKQK